MIIDKDKLEKAKKKIGDETPDIIAELLHLEKYDSKNKKALCPFHLEDTPSFVWNSKGLYMKCFGCNRTMDIVDAYMETGLTFIEACEKVFELANMPYAFGEKGVKTKSQYRYPYEEQCFDLGKVYEYFGKRCISEETLNYCDVRQDKYGNAVFNYYDTNDVLTMVKYKPTHKIDKSKGEMKSWCQKDADTTQLLFNMNRVNPNQPLAILEGEPDCLAAIEAGYKNAVSVPLGANNYGWIETNWNFLEQFDSIILGFDNDEAGQKALNEVIYRLGSWRTKIINVPEIIEVDNNKIKCKDLNEMLFYLGKNKVLDAIINAKDTPVTSVVDFSDVEDLDLDKMEGIETGYEQLDKELYKIFYGTLTILTGQPSAGKSSFINQLIANALDEEVHTWLYSREMPENITSNWAMLSFAGSGNIMQYEGRNGVPYYRVPQDVKNKIKNWARGKLFIYKDDAPNDTQSIYQSMEDCVRKYGVHLLIIDNLMMMNMGCTDENKYEKQTEVINYLIDFSKKYNVAVVLVAHPRKMDTNTDVGMYDVSGSSNIINLAARSIGLRRVSKSEKEDGTKQFSNYDVVLTIIKDRVRGTNEYQMGFHYDPPSRRFYTNYDEYRKDYKWDDQHSNSNLPVPEKLVDYAENLYKN